MTAIPTSCKSLPNIQFSSKFSRTLQLQRRQSLPSCLKFTSVQIQFRQRPSISNQLSDKQKRSDPTIGELLGDDDLFHYRYHHHYSSSRCKRKQYYHQSHSRSSSIHDHRKHRRSTCSHTTDRSPSKLIQSIPDTHQFYPYSIPYSYTPIPTYTYYCCPTMTSCCPCGISDPYGGIYSQERSAF